MRRLVIAEKGSAALRLAVLLSGGSFKRRRVGVTAYEFARDGVDHVVVGLRGHIVEIDYPDSLRDWAATDLDVLVATVPEERVTEPKIADALRTLAARADEAWICTDYDREGELIGVEALRIAREGRPDLPAKRPRFSALTKAEVEEAFHEPADVDERLAASARAREEIDLAWGAALTRFLSLACRVRGRDLLSVGRVQTPTLALLVEREREVEEFVPQPQWTVTANLATAPAVRAVHATDPFWRRDEAEAAAGRASLTEDALVVETRSETVDVGRPPPLHTTGFLAEATRRGLSAAKAMAIAEDLYRKGLLSYPRTDNTVYPRSLGLRRLLERLRDSDFAAEAEALLAPGDLHPSRGPTEATDHPPMHPTAGARRADMKPDRWQVYEIVARRFLATLAPPAREIDTMVRFDIGAEPFLARGRRLLEPGWRAYEPRPFPESEVPELAVGDWVPVSSVDLEEGETEPPPSYGQGDLIREMERLGLGTKSTRHDIVQKLYDRRYVEGRRIRVTGPGRAVVEALEAYGGQVARSEMTARLERAMDAIAEGRRQAGDVVAESRALLASVLAGMREHEAGIARWVRAAVADETEFGPCDRCDGTMVLRRARTGRRFLGCSNFPSCRNGRDVPGPGLLLPSLEACGRCGMRKVSRVHRGLEDLRCVAPHCSDAELAEILGV